ncbi:uncharacterized protein N7483_009917 [Penicillium malachiteum]|uniref:uncharacterized protein n=1 Tax=Penicillium malachiteum TaxID=1324776 RepID=UPI0025495236|nr:uncharacterized protein N7483_009917 [Penicillium malachiteum]KAJ5718835.1 hypothetical protein N7483_009917 [Penicillium malachiteum]
MMRSTKSPFELKPKYPDFKKVEATRPAFDPSLPIVYTQTPDPRWEYGKGAISSPQACSSLESSHVEIDPYGSDRAMIDNYRLLVSGIPRPISFVSTLSKDGTPNLAPFSYFQLVDHDPPTFVIGFSARASRPKDTQKNLIETGECVINVVSDHFVEAANATSLDVESSISEWGLSGLKSLPSATVRAGRLKDSIFSIEGKLLEMKDLDYHGHAKQGKPVGSLAVIQGTRFWVRSDAINDHQDEIDLSVMRPVVQLGGIQYSRVRETFELPRPSLATELAREGSNLANFMKK